MAGHDDSDDEIQILSSHESTSDRKNMKCEICSTDLQKLTVGQRQEHYETHFSDPPNRGVPAASSSASMKSNNRFKLLRPSTKRKRVNSEDVFWHPSQGTPPPENYTPGIIHILKKALLKSHAKGSTQKAYLCCDRAVHVKSQGWDRGWGCGYRNFEMACVPLMEEPQQPVYFALLDDPTPPGVENLQKWLENAWKEGYDPEGAAHFKHTLVGTRKWIGTADIYVAFTSRGIPAILVDFDLSDHGPDVLIQWIVNHFTQDPPKQAHTTVNDALLGAAPIVITSRLPVILQHSGHSRTVIGYERTSGNSVNLLIFDPSKGVSSNLRKLALSNYTFAANERSRQSQDDSKLSPKKLLNHVLHPMKSKDDIEPAHKRVRADTHANTTLVKDADLRPGQSSKSALSITDPEAAEILKLFRVNPSSLKRRDKYQILYFPLTEPLDEAQRQSRREVTSIKISKP